MASGKFVAYYRVSTKAQGASGLGLDAQRSSVRAYLNGGAWTLVDEFTEVESGKRADRIELGKAIARCRREGATLVIAKLDRLSRDLAFIANLMESGIEFVAVDNPTANKLTVHILAAVAQAEREAISARTKAALAEAKNRGVKLGTDGQFLTDEGRRKGAARSAKAQRTTAMKAYDDLAETVRSMHEAGASLRAIANKLNEDGYRTREGAEFKAPTIQRILKRS